MLESSDFPPGTEAAKLSRASNSLTEGPIIRSLLMFSLPMMGGNILQSLNGTVNQFWISHTLGVSAITAIVNSNLIIFLMFSAILGVTMAANVLVAQAVGAGDLALVKRVMGTAITFFFMVSATVGIVGWIITPGLLTLMHTPDTARAEAIIYLRIMFASMPFTAFFAFAQMALRGAGDSHTPFYFMTVAVVIDVTLNPMLIRGLGPFPRLGIAGSATSTLIGQGVSLLMLLAYLYRRRNILVLWPGEFHLLKPRLALIKPLVLRGLPMGGSMAIMSSAALVMIGFVNGFGALTAAAYGGASLVWSYIQMPGMAIGASVSSMAAQNVGAQRWDRVDRIARAGLISTICVTGALALLIYLAGAVPLYLFLPMGSPTIPIALHINRAVLWTFVLFNASFALTGVMRATGAVVPPLIILIVSTWVIRLPFTAYMTPRFGQEAIWWSFALGTITSTLLTALYYRFGGWRNKRMMGTTPGPAGA